MAHELQIASIFTDKIFLLAGSNKTHQNYMAPYKELCHLNKFEIIFWSSFSSWANRLKEQIRVISDFFLLLLSLFLTSSGGFPLGSLSPSFLCIPLTHHPSSYQNNHNNLQTDSIPTVPAHSNPSISLLTDSPSCNTGFFSSPFPVQKCLLIPCSPFNNVQKSPFTNVQKSESNPPKYNNFWSLVNVGMQSFAYT